MEDGANLPALFQKTMRSHRGKVVVGAIHELPLPINLRRVREIGNVVWRGTLVVPAVTQYTVKRWKEDCVGGCSLREPRPALWRLLQPQASFHHEFAACRASAKDGPNPCRPQRGTTDAGRLYPSEIGRPTLSNRIGVPTAGFW